jgi:hypothetical protein
VVLATLICKPHSLRPIVHVVGRNDVICGKAKVFVDFSVPVVIEAIQDLLVYAAIPIIVDQSAGAEATASGLVHAGLGIRAWTPLQKGPAGHPLRAVWEAGADPEGSGVEKFLARGGRKLERGIERPAHVEERVSDDPGVGDSHAKSARVQNGPGTINLQHGLCSCGGE